MSICITEHEFFLRGEGASARTGVLLIHGLTGTPNEMRLLGKGLHRAGFTVYGMQLAGHCGTHEDLVHTTWRDWAQSVQSAADRLRHEVDRVVVMGLSMGAVLALHLAAEMPQHVAGVAALSPMFRHDGWSIPFYTRLSFLLRPIRALGIGRGRVFLEQPPYGIKDENLRARIVAQMRSGDSALAGLPGNPWHAIAEMNALSSRVLRRLKAVRAPCLVVHASEDDVCSVRRNAEVIVRRTSGPVELVLLHDSYHMITIDRERRTVMAHATRFVENIAAIAATSASSDCLVAPAAA